jgi:segregation and condensation protein A
VETKPIAQYNKYTVATSLYEGPLDLLLMLIERAELDITSLALAQVTDQYLDHIRSLEANIGIKVEEISAFLVIASKLLQIKSEVLLPRPPLREQGEEAPGVELARQLIIYKRFKELGDFLYSRESLGCHTYSRLAPSPQLGKHFDLNGITLNELIITANLVFSQNNIKFNINNLVNLPKITIGEKIILIANYLRSHSSGKFHQLLIHAPMRLDIVVTFLAVLELIKRRVIEAYQENLFYEIEIKPAEAWDETILIEPEFGE